MNNWKRFARSSRQILGGLIALCLLAPVPLFAFNFHEVSWGNGTSMNDDGAVVSIVDGESLFASIAVTPDSGNQSTTLTFTLADGRIGATGSTQIVSGLISAEVFATWSRLEALAPQELLAGLVKSPITVSIGLDGDPGPWSANNMFAETFDSDTALPYSTTVDSATASNQRIVITFTYDGSYKAISSPSTTFTLTFHNEP